MEILCHTPHDPFKIPRNSLDNRGTETLNEKQVHFNEVIENIGTGKCAGVHLA